MEFELRKKALASIESNVTEVQVVIIVLTRELAFKVAQQLNEDAGEMKCLPCINDRRFEIHLDEMKQRHFPIITLHLPPCASIVRQIQDFTGSVSCYGAHPHLIEANHFALHVSNEMRKMDTLCDLCRTNTSVPILICCSMQGTAFANAKILRAQNLPVVTLTSEMSSDDIRIAIETFQLCQVHIMITTGYIRGLIDLKTPMIIINYDLPKPDAYARRINFVGESWIAKHTVFISLIKMSERHKLSQVKEKLGLRWFLNLRFLFFYSNIVALTTSKATSVTSKFSLKQLERHALSKLFHRHALFLFSDQIILVIKTVLGHRKTCQYIICIFCITMGSETKTTLFSHF
uniref:Helicase C-terminal domain-containing protein n=1 Tax=Wuchereria bancrofti TaxID=6293 RepID=A0A1I8EYF7_WUCBA